MSDELALRVGVLKVVSDYTRDAYHAARAEAQQAMGRGDRWMARSPIDGSKIGAVSYSDPKPKARVSDEPALNSWVEKNYPDRMVHELNVIGSDEEVKAVLYDHAPHLLKKVTAPDPDLVRQVKTDSTELGAPVGPSGEADVDGITVDTPEGAVSCKADPAAPGVVVELFRSGRLTLEGLGQIEGGNGEG